MRIMNCIVFTFIFYNMVSFANDDCSRILHQDETQYAIQHSKALSGYLNEIPYEYTNSLVQNRIVIHGMPNKGHNSEPRVLSEAEVKEKVFRHYSTKESIQKIRNEKMLVAGSVAFVSSPYIFTDLTGVFMTDVGAEQEKIGLDKELHQSYIDFKIDPKITVIRIEKGIYLIPGLPATEPWFERAIKNSKPGDSYEKYKIKRDRAGYSVLKVPILDLEESIK